MATQSHIGSAQKVADQELEEKLGHTAILDAKQATDDEHSQTLWQGLRENRKAVMWSILLSMTIVMEGYDGILIGNFFAYPEFQKKFGRYFGERIGWQVTGEWQTALNMGSTAGAVVGGLINGYVASRFGYRWTLIISLGLLNAFIFVVFFAPGKEVLLVGQILCGLSWGVFATLAPAYASEVCPTNLRAYLTTYVNLCWAIGQLLATGVLRGCLHIQGEMGYRIPFAIQWLWPIPLMVVCYLAPESPWWLVRADRLDQAKHSIVRLSGEKTSDQINNQLAMMVHTIRIEAEATEGATYLDCFKGPNLRRTEIVCVAFMGQILSGSSFAYTPTYFFTTAGMDTAQAFNLSLGAKAIAFTGTVLSWWLISYWGRRPLYVWGMGLLSLILILIGVLDVSAGKKGLWPSGGLCVLWLFVYSLTIGPLAYSIIAETSSVRLRPLSVVLSRTSYQLVNIISQFFQAYMMNPVEWNFLGKTGFFWGGTAFCVFIWSYFRLPEVKGRTYEELDILFMKEVPARKFASTHVDAYAAAVSIGPDDKLEIEQKNSST
ncbi:sugar transporter [Annulohypoxylon maeteangense]|uniref:sugar transporter n=1 Tax=Annulohypoxylon maeteangense TaxID=1927788 RepID=UPI002008CBAE|nr:sugar transporter [Annulohypoxylon maeteangense]KAI0882620.1 sugar transporter [Annulohypoxylon maeteangense]